MKAGRTAGWLSLVGLALCAALPATAGAARVSPQIVVGPAVQVEGSPNASIFGCQLVGRTARCYDPYQIRKAYGIDGFIAAGSDGTGHTIVIVDAFQSPTITQDLALFNATFALPAAPFSQIAPDGLTPFDPADGNMVGWSAEISLDVQWAHAIAPGASIVLVLAKSNEDADILSAVKYAVDHNLGDVISMSFGEAETCVDPAILASYHDVFASATMKGITLFASSGDQGAAQPSCDGKTWIKAASSPASDPLVSGVGGTELNAAGVCLVSRGCDPTANPPAGLYVSEEAWNEDGDSSTGGGISVLFDAPPFQKSAVKASGRGVPDVAYNAGVNTGVIAFWGVPFGPGAAFRFGGTSAGSPQWAGLLAIANQVAGRRLGYLNSALYQIRQTPPNYGPSFHDVTTGNNSVIEVDADGNDVVIAGFLAGPAWDATTGIGTPKADGLVGRLIKLVSPGDAVSAIATSKPHGNTKPPKAGAMQPH
jgi:subtilase family serine protease